MRELRQNGFCDNTAYVWPLNYWWRYFANRYRWPTVAHFKLVWSGQFLDCPDSFLVVRPVSGLSGQFLGYPDNFQPVSGQIFSERISEYIRIKQIIRIWYKWILLIYWYPSHPQIAFEHLSLLYIRTKTMENNGQQSAVLQASLMPFL